jgi:CRISPR-associated protein Cst2
MREEGELIYEIAIMGRIAWNLHSLSNEGTVGNVTEPRSIRIINPNTREATTTDGISGEMLKHIHAEKMWELENEKQNFCEACKQLKPEKADGVKSVKEKKKADEAVDEALKCELCDIHGFLVQKPTVSRSSTVEFGWALGIPQVIRDIHTHARHSVHEELVMPEEEKEAGKWGDVKCSVKECETDQSESKLYKIKGKWYCEDHIPERAVQMLYHRPTRSGEYAIVSVFQPWRIGLNNVTIKYTNGINRENRYKLALKAYMAMFTRTEGAMTSTRLPHTTNFSGIIVIAKDNMPVPVISPLKENFIDEIKKISENLKGKIEVIDFNSMSEFVEKLNGLVDKKPYSIKTE